MTWKIITLLGAAIAAFFMFRRSLGGQLAAALLRKNDDENEPRAGSEAETMVACTQCGAYRVKNRICDCQSAPTL